MDGTAAIYASGRPQAQQQQRARSSCGSSPFCNKLHRINLPRSITPSPSHVMEAWTSRNGNGDAEANNSWLPVAHNEMLNISGELTTSPLPKRRCSSPSLPKRLVLQSRDKESLLDEIITLKRALTDQASHVKRHKVRALSVELENRKLEKDIEALEVKGSAEAPRTGGPSRLRAKLQGLKMHLEDLQSTCDSQQEEIGHLRRDIRVTRTREVEAERDVFAGEISRLQKAIKRLKSLHDRVSCENRELSDTKAKASKLEVANHRLETCVEAVNKTLERANYEVTENRNRASELNLHVKMYQNKYRELEEHAFMMAGLLEREKIEKQNSEIKLAAMRRELAKVEAMQGGVWRANARNRDQTDTWVLPSESVSNLQQGMTNFSTVKTFGRSINQVPFEQASKVEASAIDYASEECQTSTDLMMGLFVPYEEMLQKMQELQLQLKSKRNSLLVPKLNLDQVKSSNREEKAVSAPETSISEASTISDLPENVSEALVPTLLKKPQEPVPFVSTNKGLRGLAEEVVESTVNCVIEKLVNEPRSASLRESKMKPEESQASIALGNPSKVPESMRSIEESSVHGRTNSYATNQGQKSPQIWVHQDAIEEVWCAVEQILHEVQRALQEHPSKGDIIQGPDSPSVCAAKGIGLDASKNFAGKIVEKILHDVQRGVLEATSSIGTKLERRSSSRPPDTQHVSKDSVQNVLKEILKEVESELPLQFSSRLGKNQVTNEPILQNALSKSPVIEDHAGKLEASKVSPMLSSRNAEGTRPSMEQTFLISTKLDRGGVEAPNVLQELSSESEIGDRKVLDFGYRDYTMPDLSNNPQNSPAVLSRVENPSENKPHLTTTTPEHVKLRENTIPTGLTGHDARIIEQGTHVETILQQDPLDGVHLSMKDLLGKLEAETRVVNVNGREQSASVHTTAKVEIEQATPISQPANGRNQKDIEYTRDIESTLYNILDKVKDNSLQLKNRTAYAEKKSTITPVEQGGASLTVRRELAHPSPRGSGSKIGQAKYAEDERKVISTGGDQNDDQRRSEIHSAMKDLLDNFDTSVQLEDGASGLQLPDGIVKFKVKATLEHIESTMKPLEQGSFSLASKEHIEEDQCAHKDRKDVTLTLLDLLAKVEDGCGDIEVSDQGQRTCPHLDVKDDIEKAEPTIKPIAQGRTSFTLKHELEAEAEDRTAGSDVPEDYSIEDSFARGNPTFIQQISEIEQTMNDVLDKVRDVSDETSASHSRSTQRDLSRDCRGEHVSARGNQAKIGQISEGELTGDILLATVKDFSGDIIAPHFNVILEDVHEDHRVGNQDEIRQISEIELTMNDLLLKVKHISGEMSAPRFEATLEDVPRDYRVEDVYAQGNQADIGQISEIESTINDLLGKVKDASVDISVPHSKIAQEEACKYYKLEDAYARRPEGDTGKISEIEQTINYLLSKVKDVSGKISAPHLRLTREDVSKDYRMEDVTSRITYTSGEVSGPYYEKKTTNSLEVKDEITGAQSVARPVTFKCKLDSAVSSEDTEKIADGASDNIMVKDEPDVCTQKNPREDLQILEVNLQMKRILEKVDDVSVHIGQTSQEEKTRCKDDDQNAKGSFAQEKSNETGTFSELDMTENDILHNLAALSGNVCQTNQEEITGCTDHNHQAQGLPTQGYSNETGSFSEVDKAMNDLVEKLEDISISITQKNKEEKSARKDDNQQGKALSSQRNSDESGQSSDANTNINILLERLTNISLSKSQIDLEQRTGCEDYQQAQDEAEIFSDIDIAMNDILGKLENDSINIDQTNRQHRSGCKDVKQQAEDLSALENLTVCENSSEIDMATSDILRELEDVSGQINSQHGPECKDGNQQAEEIFALKDPKVGENFSDIDKVMSDILGKVENVSIKKNQTKLQHRPGSKDDSPSAQERPSEAGMWC